MSFRDFFLSVTPAQAELVSSATGLLSVLLAAVLAPLAFHVITRRGVADFKTAIEDVTRSANFVRDRTTAMGKDVTMLENKLVEINELLSALQKNVSTTQSKQDDEIQEIEVPQQVQTEQQVGVRLKLKGAWNTLREKLENISSDASISAHARARYARIDRRDYRELVRTLDRDERLGKDASHWLRAIDIWYQYRPNNQLVDPNALDELIHLADRLSKTIYDPPSRDLALADRIHGDVSAGILPEQLTTALVQDRYSDYAPETTRTVLANYAEGGYFQSKGQRPRFKKIADGIYEILKAEGHVLRS